MVNATLVSFGVFLRRWRYLLPQYQIAF